MPFKRIQGLQQAHITRRHPGPLSQVAIFPGSRLMVYTEGTDPVEPDQSTNPAFTDYCSFVVQSQRFARRHINARSHISPRSICSLRASRACQGGRAGPAHGLARTVAGLYVQRWHARDFMMLIPRRGTSDHSWPFWRFMTSYRRMNVFCMSVRHRVSRITRSEGS